MEMFSFQDLILFATFLITLLAYIDRNRKNRPCSNKIRILIL